MSEEIAIYTENVNDKKYEELRRFLARSGFPYEEKDLSRDPGFRSEVDQKFGGVTLPGISVGSVWIPGDSEDLYETLGRYFVDQMLMDAETSSQKGSVNSKDNGVLKPELTAEEDIAQINDQFAAATSRAQNKARAAQTQNTAPAPAGGGGRMPAAGAPMSNSVFPTVKLPNGTDVTVGALSRLLMQATKHHCVPDEENPYYYFRGSEGMELWSLLFFDTHDEEGVTEFGQMLIRRGIVHNYTPNCDKFQNAFLVLQPLQEPRVLNTFVKWPSTDISCEEDPMDVILRLSRQMDDICAKGDFTGNLKLFQEFEEASCQLQEIAMPTDPVERVTFALNLFNLMVRHAMVVAESRKWGWPSTLDELLPFFNKIGYTVSGDWMSIKDLLDCLYGRSGEITPTLFAGRRKWWSCKADPNKAINQHFISSMIHTDPRILMATTWGTKSSPTVTTVYPNRLEEGLQTAAETYCQDKVFIGYDQVALPVTLSWYREDFGGSPDQVLYNILPYLSVTQLRQIQDLREMARLNVVFDGHYNWTCGLPSKEKLMQAPGMEQAQSGQKGKRRFGNPQQNGGFKMPEPEDEEEEDDDDDGSKSQFTSDFSEITYGSEFEDLLGSRSQRRLGL